MALQDYPYDDDEEPYEETLEDVALSVRIGAWIQGFALGILCSAAAWWWL